MVAQPTVPRPTTTQTGDLCPGQIILVHRRQSEAPQGAHAAHAPPTPPSRPLAERDPDLLLRAHPALPPNPTTIPDPALDQDLTLRPLPKLKPPAASVPTSHGLLGAL